MHDSTHANDPQAHPAIPKTLNLIAAIACAWFWFFPIPYFSLIILILIPALTIMVWFQSNASYQIAATIRSDKRPSIAFAFLLPSLLLALGALLNFKLIGFMPLMWAFVGGLVTTLVMSRKDQSVKKRPKFVMFDQKLDKRSLFVATMLFLTVFYLFGAIVEANAAFDTSDPQTYRVTVLRKTTAYGGIHSGTHFNVWVAPWGPHREVTSESVGREVYDSVATGQSVCIDLHPGAMKTPWYLVYECR